MRILLLSLTTSILATLASFAAPAQNIEFYRNSLPAAKSPADSVAILYNIYDLSPRADQIDVGLSIFHTAARAHDYSAQNDILRQIAVLYGRSEPSRFDALIHLAESLPASADRRVTIHFIEMQSLASQIHGYSDEQRAENLSSILRHHPKEQDLLDSVKTAQRICLLLGAENRGSFYLETLNSLDSLIEALPKEAYPIRNQYYIARANIYTNIGRPADAIAADRKTLTIINELEATYRAAGRLHRSYAQSRYSVYRRMLQNYRALSPAEIEQIYSAVQKLAATDADVAANEQRTPRARAYYLMATGKYAEALPLFRSLLDSPKLSLIARRHYLREMRVAAEALGDDKLLLEVLKEYTDVVEKDDSLMAAANVRELEIRYFADKMRLENNRLREQALRATIEQSKQTRLYYIAAILFLLMLMAILLPLLMRRARRARQA